MERKYRNYYKEQRKPIVLNENTQNALRNVMGKMGEIGNGSGEVIFEYLPFQDRITLLNYIERFHGGLRVRLGAFTPVRLQDCVWGCS